MDQTRWDHNRQTKYEAERKESPDFKVMDTLYRAMAILMIVIATRCGQVEMTANDGKWL